MTTRIRRPKRIRKEGLTVNELYRSDVLEYTMVYYDASDGDPEDPATQTDRRVAVFSVGKAPEDLQRAANKEIGDGYISYYEGLPNALLDDICEVTQESDHEAEDFRRQERDLMKSRREYDWRTNKYVEQDGSEYESFLQAIDRIAKDDTDEDAWKIIAKWRDRQLRQEERV